MRPTRRAISCQAGGGRATGAVIACAVGLLLVTAGCRRDPVEVAPVVAARPVRVLLFDTREGLRVRTDGPARVSDANNQPSDTRPLGTPQVDTPQLDTAPLGTRHLDWTTLTPQSLRINGRPVIPPVLIEPVRDGSLLVSRIESGRFESVRQYRGGLEIQETDDGGLRVINEVDVESYVAGVVACEVVSHFQQTTLEAQAIAARGYVLFAMSRAAQRDYDVRASEGDQVYRGIAHSAIGRRSRQAVNRTRGLVLAEATPRGPRIFPTYYASACGGHTQSVGAVQPGPVPEPLAGGVACDYCRIAPRNVYRWGPRELSGKMLLKRLAQRYKTARKWRSIASVSVTAREPGGHITQVLVTGDNGDKLVLGGERFRLAVGSRVMRSTNCTLKFDGRSILLTDGKGFGHGLGMCQWGAEGQARQGRTAGQILAFYYPGSRLVRAY